jgi:3'-5' exoribonuclease
LCSEFPESKVASELKSTFDQGYFMAAKIQVKDLTSKDEIESLFLIKNIQLQEAKDGKKYLGMVLSDSSGEIEARVWQNAENIFKDFHKNHIIKVRGKLNFFQGKKQFIVQDLVRAPDEQIQLDDFVVKASEHPDKMYKNLLNIIENLEDVYIRDLLSMILKDEEILRRLKKWQAGKSIHHAYQSGLLEHILSCTELAISLSKHYQVNVNYVVAGCVLHDLCKIYELTDGLNVDYTEEGKLVGHLVKGIEILDKYSYRIKNFPHPMKMHLKHILLSHHGEYEYGSPKIPATSEAYLVHLIDLMDSKMNSMTMAKRADSSTGNWTGFVKHLDRIVYKSELPTFTQYEDDESVTAVKKPASKELKQNLGKMLEDWKK